MRERERARKRGLLGVCPVLRLVLGLWAAADPLAWREQRKGKT